MLFLRYVQLGKAGCTAERRYATFVHVLLEFQLRGHERFLAEVGYKLDMKRMPMQYTLMQILKYTMLDCNSTQLIAV